MIFNYGNPYQQNVSSNHYFSDSPPSQNPISPPFGSYQPSQSSIDYLVGPIDPKQNNSERKLNLPAIVGDQDPLNRFLDSKKESLTTVAKSILEQMYERTAIRNQNFYEIDQRVSRDHSILDQLETIYLGMDPVVDKRKAILHQELIAFEQERRFEAVSCWRDISRLKLQLGEIGQLLDNHASRERLIEG
ncbi:MAG: hypothetical protein WAU88_08260 [Candidatus Zixiibacteriota bacterium]